MVAYVNIVQAGENDSSSAGNLMPTDRRYCWPPQNDGYGDNYFFAMTLNAYV